MRARQLPVAALTAALLVSLIPSLSVARPANRFPPQVVSPPGQVVVATVNARQAKVLDLFGFRRLYSLILSIGHRPVAFNGGARRAVGAPDVLVIEEMPFSNLEIFQKLLNQRSQYEYEMAVAEGSRPKFLYNSKTVTLLGTPTTWLDPCRTGTDGEEIRMYQFARFVENKSGVGFTVAGVHFPPRYSGLSRDQCRRSNVAELRRQLLAETTPVIVAGDFNQRPVTEFHECDPNETSEPTPWWSLMTTSLDGGPAYVDSVRSWHRRRRVSMEHEWTHEMRKTSQTCTGRVQRRRSRIDYIFTLRALVAEARTDHPGWAGGEPGTRHPENEWYSDHRLVWGRFVLGGPGRPAPPTPRRATGGVIDLSWSPVEGAAGYLVYRARAGHRYAALERLDGTALGYSDTTASHATRYRYALVGIGANGAHGPESRPVRATADARGPRVTGITPSSGATRVARKSKITVRFDEGVDLESVHAGTIELVQKAIGKSGRDRRVAGRLRVLSPRSLIFHPNRRLEARRTFVVIVRVVRDRLGNWGTRFASRFAT